MVVSDFHAINELIDKEEWVKFGKPSFCAKPSQAELKLYRDTGKLPSPCDGCYKVLIFWEDNFTKENIGRFVKTVNKIEDQVSGRFSRDLAVFHFQTRRGAEEFIDNFAKKMLEHDITGTTQWRRACKFYQDMRPQNWRNSKDYIPPKPAP